MTVLAIRGVIYFHYLHIQQMKNLKSKIHYNKKIQVCITQSRLAGLRTHSKSDEASYGHKDYCPQLDRYEYGWSTCKLALPVQAVNPLFSNHDSCAVRMNSRKTASRARVCFHSRYVSMQYGRHLTSGEALEVEKAACSQRLLIFILFNLLKTGLNQKIKLLSCNSVPLNGCKLVH